LRPPRQGARHPRRSGHELRRRPERARQAAAPRGAGPGRQEAGHLDDDGARSLRLRRRVGAMTGAAPARCAAAATAWAALVAAGPGCARREPPPPGPMASALVALAADLGAEPSEVAGAWR